MPYAIAAIPAVLLILLAAVYAAYRMAFHSPNRAQGDIYNLPSQQHQAKRDIMIRLIDALKDIPFEKVHITSHDGLKLMGRYYHQSEGAPVAICMHGYRGAAIRDFCGGSRIAMGLGHNLLIVDQRAHGESQGRAITFGVEERKDCLDWIEYARGRFGADTPMALYGVSMGAATVIMAAGLGLPPNVKRVVADCPYSEPWAIISRVGKGMGIPPWLAYPFIWLGAKLFAGFDLNGASAVEAARAARTPVLIIHGEEDRFVPCAMSRAIRDANPGLVRLHTFPNAGHGLSYIEDGERYRKLVCDFLSGI